MVMSESIRFEKLFQEDHASGGKAEFATGGSTDCAGVLVAAKSMMVRATDRKWVNLFVSKRRNVPRFLPACIHERIDE